ENINNFNHCNQVLIVGIRDCCISQQSHSLLYFYRKFVLLFLLTLPLRTVVNLLTYQRREGYLRNILGCPFSS
ncbi:MAG: hypothetical protein KKB76_00865, partial [Candidatus Omnitrophica bacterium]|nr:hypothetical protein [Candidatus Omnitrophota bacterium]